MTGTSCVILFSGGTDSFCTAALSCGRYAEVHLLTFYENATRSSPVPAENVRRLRAYYPDIRIIHNVISTDRIVRELYYENYFANLLKFHFLNLATPGLSSLSWHIAAILYCQRNGIAHVHDGMTKELQHLPGHMPEIRTLFTELYRHFGIEFSGPVLDWEVPEDQQFVDRLIVDRHGFTLHPRKKIRTTGEWLFERGLLPHPNVKGSAFDRQMQHDCYPFVVYNMMVFWLVEPLIGFENYKRRLAAFIRAKTVTAAGWLRTQSKDPDAYTFLQLSHDEV